jgi:hypothetical protein
MWISMPVTDGSEPGVVLNELVLWRVEEQVDQGAVGGP